MGKTHFTGSENPSTEPPARGSRPTSCRNFCGDEVLLHVLIFAILFALVGLLRSLGLEPLIEIGLILLFISMVSMNTTGLLCQAGARPLNGPLQLPKGGELGSLAHAGVDEGSPWDVIARPM